MSQPPYPPPGTPDPAGSGPADDGARAAEQGHGTPYYGQQPPYGQAAYGPPPGYGQPPYGQAGPGQAPYGQPPYAQPPYGGGVPPWGPGPGQPAPGKSRRLVAGIVAGAALLIVAFAVALVVGLRSDDGSGSGGNSSIPEATSDPDGLGDDAELDSYAEDCHDGDMEACDDLFRFAPLDSAYELYGGSCAGRQSNSEARAVYCVDAFPPAS